MSRRLPARGAYDLKSVVFSHGWSDLPPFQVERDDGTLSVALRTETGPLVVRLAPAGNGVRVGSARWSAGIEAAVRWMFRLDDDLAEFYGAMARHGRSWAGRRRMGRLLRSQTVFEDVVKLVLTTNCGWSLTRLMTERLAGALGEKTPDGPPLFPSAAALADRSEAFYRKTIRAGYRSPHLPKLGELFASGAVDPTRWVDPARPTEEIRKEILALPGAGPYVADNLLRFLGRYDRLGLDSWARRKLGESWGMKRPPSDRTIERRYAPFGAHRGLVLWCDLTHDWFRSDDFRSWIRVTEAPPRGGEGAA